MVLAEAWADNPHLPDIDVIATERELDRLPRLTVQIRVNSIGKAPEVPLSHRLVRLDLVVISAHDDIDMATDELDEVVPVILNDLDKRFPHDDAELARYGEYMAYRIPIQTLASKEI